MTVTEVSLGKSLLIHDYQKGPNNNFDNVREVFKQSCLNEQLTILRDVYDLACETQKQQVYKFTAELLIQLPEFNDIQAFMDDHSTDQKLTEAITDNKKLHEIIINPEALMLTQKAYDYEKILVENYRLPQKAMRCDPEISKSERQLPSNFIEDRQVQQNRIQSPLPFSHFINKNTGNTTETETTHFLPSDQHHAIMDITFESHSETSSQTKKRDNRLIFDSLDSGLPILSKRYLGIGCSPTSHGGPALQGIKKRGKKESVPQCARQRREKKERERPISVDVAMKALEEQCWEPREKLQPVLESGERFELMRGVLKEANEEYDAGNLKRAQALCDQLSSILSKPQFNLLPSYWRDCKRRLDKLQSKIDNEPTPWLPYKIKGYWGANQGRVNDSVNITTTDRQLTKGVRNYYQGESLV